MGPVIPALFAHSYRTFGAASFVQKAQGKLTHSPCKTPSSLNHVLCVKSSIYINTKNLVKFSSSFQSDNGSPLLNRYGVVLGILTDHRDGSVIKVYKYYGSIKSIMKHIKRCSAGTSGGTSYD